MPQKKHRPEEIVAKLRQVDVLLSQGRSVGDAVRSIVDTNITGTIYLIQKVGRDMRTRGRGRILITGSIAGFMPGTYQAVYNATKAFLDSFPYACAKRSRKAASQLPA